MTLESTRGTMSLPLPQLAPDPQLSANIYCAGRLDELIRFGIAPFWDAVQADEQSQGAYLWLLRYGRCGEHLKVRFHGPESERERVRARLQESVSGYLAALDAPPADRSSDIRTALPAIDVEDHASALYPDRTLLWTQYRRSPVSLGGNPWQADDGYVALFTRCLGRAWARLHAALGQGDPFRSRQTLLLRALLEGLAELAWPADKCVSYLTYHRDWLVRFSITKSNQEPARGAELMAVFEQRVDRMGTALQAIQRAVQQVWPPGVADVPAASDNLWHGSLRALDEYMAQRRHDPDYFVDPFASDMAFPAVFKVNHGAASHFGLHLHDEAFTHHLLLHALSGGNAPAFTHGLPRSMVA
jgi:hypothetical protein